MASTTTRAVFWIVAMTVAVAADSVLHGRNIYRNENCTGTPLILSMANDSSCATTNCVKKKFGSDDYWVSNACNISDRFEYALDVFSQTDYVVLEIYTASGCETIHETFGLAPTGSCQVANNATTLSLIATRYSNESVSISYFAGGSCELDEFRKSYSATATSLNVSRGDCITPGYRVYSSVYLNAASSSASANAASSSASASGSDSVTSSTVSSESSSGGISTGAIVGIVVGGVVVLVLLTCVGLLLYRRRSKKTQDSAPGKHEGAYAQVASPTTGHKSTGSGMTDFSSSLGLGPRSLAGLWDDEVVATARIPREKVLVQRLITRGGYGEIYYGLFLGKPVAVKTLLPELRKSVKHVNEFLDEVRLLARLEHPRIVHFVGVAWDSLADLCFVLGYEEGGDLRALLASYEAQNLEVGFDRSKVTIALHVAHALTYLHSLDPPVLHRDLKSKNILLSSELEAKVTDFGISRERVDTTMTAGVGTSLWIAPEVMLGQRYDDKADVFSLGVVLSELDLHTLPYAHAKDKNSNSGRKLPDTAVLQMVTLGKLRVEFSSRALETMVALGNSCVAVDPKDRPTAAEVLYNLQTILWQDL